ncbi:MAG TPA: hypothetical protein VKA82_06795 [Rubrobacter sp.]|nr:hypothetical protein [Rubrobacter sp.]
MEVFIPHAEYAAASRLYRLAEIHAQENTTGVADGHQSAPFCRGEARSIQDIGP